MGLVMTTSELQPNLFTLLVFEDTGDSLSGLTINNLLIKIGTFV